MREKGERRERKGLKKKRESASGQGLGNGLESVQGGPGQSL